MGQVFGGPSRLDMLGILGLEYCANAVDSAPYLVNEKEAFSEALSVPEVTEIYCYSQPKGAAEMNLTSWVGVTWNPEELRKPSCMATQRLWRLNRVVERLQAALGDGADWVGIYRVVYDETAGCKSLLKEAYRGAHSIGLFPLTEEFALKSNNSNCAISRKAKVIADTNMRNVDEPYFE
eukprot:gnl/MRDRNA2_/MRDRNA2_69005_c0_seq2.p1 gnl/MRDRNA2_/MRDRNA2_69005_c0~~gnl/MRDRNA2_/MRDRNA2_69005_c0_seq2.p1  ORF type:complete len:179 (+),score=33.08 gnl/MRDRNA2_/MRDRNA2_69005_c0_seq2:69-605(+)